MLVIFLFYRRKWDSNRRWTGACNGPNLIDVLWSRAGKCHYFFFCHGHSEAYSWRATLLCRIRLRTHQNQFFGCFLTVLALDLYYEPQFKSKSYILPLMTRVVLLGHSFLSHSSLQRKVSPVRLLSSSERQTSGEHALQNEQTWPQNPKILLPFTSSKKILVGKWDTLAIF